MATKNWNSDGIEWNDKSYWNQSGTPKDSTDYEKMWEALKREHPFQQYNLRPPTPVLKPITEPKYDTLRLSPSPDREFHEQNAFQVPLGQHDWGGFPKTYADTNMPIGGQLGSPIMARWTFMRVHFEKWTGIEDAIECKEKMSLQLILGQSTVHLNVALGSMNPTLPKGGVNIIDKKIKSGLIRFWPWYEIPLMPMDIDSTMQFGVRVNYNGGFKPKNDMRIKILLGPTLYVNAK